MPRLSIVIACLGRAEQFENTLASVLRNRPADCEVLVVQPAAYDDPYQLAGEVRFIQALQAPTTTALIRAGIVASSGRVVHTIGCGLEATEGWVEPAWARFSDDQVASVIPLVLSEPNGMEVTGLAYTPGGRRCLVAGTVDRPARQARWRLGPVLSAGFYRRSVLQSLDAPRSDLGERLADADLALSIAALGGKQALEPRSRLVGSIPHQPFIPSWRDGIRAERLFWRYADRSRRSVFKHALLITGQTIWNVLSRNGLRPGTATALCGRLFAALDPSDRFAARRRLRQLGMRQADAAGVPAVSGDRMGEVERHERAA